MRFQIRQRVHTTHAPADGDVVGVDAGLLVDHVEVKVGDGARQDAVGLVQVLGLFDQVVEAELDGLRAISCGRISSDVT